MTANNVTLGAPRQTTNHHHDHDSAAACACDHAPVAPHDAAALISARGLKLRRAGRELIAGVDLDIFPGEIVTLIGPNGAGKTTLVKIMLGLEKPDAGSVMRPATTRVGYVPQRFDVDATIPITVARFLMLGHDATRSDVVSALEEVGARGTIDQPLSKLSGGETQRVLIARALLRGPSLLVLDEPASGIDVTGEADLYDLISRLRDKRRLGVLLVSHDLHVVMATSDRVICLNGHVCCSGKPETVSQHPEYGRLFAPQVADKLGVYLHHHDHRHDLRGGMQPIDAPDISRNVPHDLREPEA